MQINYSLAQGNIYSEKIMGDILNAAGKAYFAQLDGFNTLLSEA